MQSVKELRAIKHGKKLSMQSITAKESEDSPLSDDDLASFSKLKEECDAIEARIARLKASAEDDAADADEAPDDEKAKKNWEGNAPKYDFDKKAFNLNTSNEIRVARTKASPAAGRYIVGQWFVKEYGMTAARDMIDQHMGDQVVSKMLTTSQPIIPQDFMNDWIELLQEQSVMRTFCRTMPMPYGNRTIPRQRLGSVGQWITEGAQSPVTQLAFDNLQLIWKKYSATSYCSREFLEYTPLNASGIISQDLTSRLGLLEDRTFLNAPANVSGVPTGIINQVNATNMITSTGGTSPTFQTVGYDLQATELALTGHLVNGTFTWIMHPAVRSFLMQLSSSFGVYPFRDEVSRGTLNGHRILTTVQLPTNLGSAGLNQTNIILACGEQVIIADAQRFALSMTTEGSFLDGGTQINTFGQDLVAFKCGNEVDFTLAHDVSAAVLSATAWGFGTDGVGGIDSYVQAANTQGSFASSAVM